MMNKIIFYIFCIAIYFSNVSISNANQNELRVTLQSSAISLDPGGVQDSQSLFVSRQVDCQLVRNQGSRFTLDAAESIKYINPLTILIKISDKAKFHDGTSVTSEDVLASFNYIKDTRNIFKNFYVWINDINIDGKKTLIIHLNQYIPQFLKVLAGINFTIFKKEFLNHARMDKNLWKYPMGCGGYEVREYNGNQIKLQPLYSGLPIIFYLISENQLKVEDASKYDIVTLSVIGNIDYMKDYEILEMFDPLQYFVGLNAKSVFWKSKSERCQFLSNLNIDGLIKSYGNSAIAANDLLPKGTLGYNPKSNYAKDLAGLYRQEIKHQNEFSSKPFCLSYLTVSIPSSKKSNFINVFKKHYSNIMIDPIFNVKKFGKKFVDDDCDALLFALKTNYFDGYEYLTIFENNDANFSGLHDPGLNSHILKSQVIESANSRAADYQKIINEIKQLCIVRPLFTIPNRRVYIRKNVKTPGIGLITIHQYYLGNVVK